MEAISSVEFSRIVPFDQIGINGLDYHIEAKEEERRLLAQRFHLVSIHQLSAQFTLYHDQEPKCYHIEGEVTGDVVQSCVSTLKDVAAHVQAPFHILMRPSQEANKEEEFLIDLDDERDIEYYTQGWIDLGETAAQYLYLNLDPFPHAPDAPDFLEENQKASLNPLSYALKGFKKSGER